MDITKSLCESLCITQSELLKFSATAPHRYKVYEIPKRSGKGTRTIAHPSKELKFIQRIIVSFLKKSLPIHKSAYAYRAGLGIKDNALIHAKNQFILKLDFKDFFPSISPELFISKLEEIGIQLSETDIFLMSNLLFWKFRRNSSLRLSIGAPSSPLISNFVMYRFDERISTLCEKEGIAYTRYADDLTFSTNKKNILFEVPLLVTQILKSETQGVIKLNNEKTVFSSKAHNRHVTGVTITNNGKISVGRDRKRRISAMIHKFKLNILNETQKMELKGLLAFASHIEEDFYFKMCKKYGEDTLKSLLKTPPS